MTYNRQDLIKDVAEKTGLTKKDSNAVIDAMFASIQNNLAKGEKVQLIGFGSFETRDRAARTGRNPRTGEEFMIEATTIPAFKPGKELKDAVK
ncbi:DNA-binding protein HU-beta [Weissella uvarum]|uniref:HU family DNA-binding protein n=1 Tax=Weissella uvarum TaxID=1479233 RepID=UPI00195FB34D|nr:HU family DNA-binding protein [Weissella uvarum]MBM7617401.1 DNA-binding protein HU-beta [Weissella uvarum]MCM0595715.1 HU family DNA-binding protein [Weissella uvarum]